MIREGIGQGTCASLVRTKLWPGVNSPLEYFNMWFW